MQAQIWKNQHPDGCARPSRIKTSSAFPWHKHIPMQHTFQHTDSPYLHTAEQSLPVCCMLQAQNCKTKIVQCKQQPRNNIQFQTVPSHGLVTTCISEQQRELNSHHCRRAWLKPAELGQSFSSLGIVSPKEKNNKEVIAFL